MVGDTLVFTKPTQFHVCSFGRKWFGHSAAFSDSLLGAETLSVFSVGRVGSLLPS